MQIEWNDESGKHKLELALPKVPNIAKVGDKGRHVEIPEGWEVVKSGGPKLGDRFLLCPSYDRWVDIDKDDLDDVLANYDCLIRKVGG